MRIIPPTEAQARADLTPAAGALHPAHAHATALCCIKDFELLMLDQNACRFHGRVAYDRDYDGMAPSAAEGERVAALLAADKSVLMIGNHGALAHLPERLFPAAF